MRTFLAGLLITLAVLALLVQLALPPYLEGRVEQRLEAGGGSAKVSIGATPAILLLAGRGHSFEAEGSGLRFGRGDRRESPFDRLDGFERVGVQLTDLDAGRFQVERFELSRAGRGAAYHLSLQASTPGPIQIPVKLESTVASEQGKPRVKDARGEVGGVPAGPLAEIVLASVLDRL